MTTRCLKHEIIKMVVYNITDWERSPLHLAAIRGYSLNRLRQIFAEEGYEHYNIKDQNGVTPLLLAAQQGHLDICKEILSVTKDASIKWLLNGDTPLHSATANGHEKANYIY